MTILVLGANGQVGSHLRDQLPRARCWRRSDADLSQPHQLETTVLAAAPSVIVNAAAYTAVDRAEEEPALAWSVNAEAPAALGRAAARLGATLVHLSTDYVFDGAKVGAYMEHDPVNPQSIYGATKLAGELAVAALCPRHLILRTSWVFSEHGNNFVKTMLRLARERESLQVVDDQTGTPTYAGDIANVIAQLVGTPDSGSELPWGIHHLTGGPATSWFGFATDIFERANERGMLARVPDLQPIGTEQYPTPATRPRNSQLAPSAVLMDQLRSPPDWQKGLDMALQKIESEMQAQVE